MDEINWDEVVADARAGGLEAQKEIWSRLDDQERQMFLGALAKSKGSQLGTSGQELNGQPMIDPSQRPDSAAASIGGFGIAPEDVLGAGEMGSAVLRLAKKIPGSAVKTAAKGVGVAALAKPHPFAAYRLAQSMFRKGSKGMAPVASHEAPTAAGTLVKDVGKDVMDPSRFEDISEQVTRGVQNRAAGRPLEGPDPPNLSRSAPGSERMEFPPGASSNTPPSQWQELSKNWAEMQGDQQRVDEMQRLIASLLDKGKGASKGATKLRSPK